MFVVCPCGFAFGCPMAFTSWPSSSWLDAKAWSGMFWMGLPADWTEIAFMLPPWRTLGGDTLAQAPTIFCPWIWGTFDWAAEEAKVTRGLWGLTFAASTLFLICRFVGVRGWEDPTWLLAETTADGTAICNICELQLRPCEVLAGKDLVLFTTVWDAFCRGDPGCVSLMAWFAGCTGADIFPAWFACFTFGLGLLDDAKGLPGLAGAFKGLPPMTTPMGSCDFPVALVGPTANCPGLAAGTEAGEIPLCKAFDAICKWAEAGLGCWETWGVKTIGSLTPCGISRSTISSMSSSIFEPSTSGSLTTGGSCWPMLTVLIGGGRFGGTNEGNCDWTAEGLLRFDIKAILRGCCPAGNDECIDPGGVIGGKSKFSDGKVGVGGVLERAARFCTWRYSCRISRSNEFGSPGNTGFMADDCGTCEQED